MLENSELIDVSTLQKICTANVLYWESWFKIQHGGFKSLSGVSLADDPSLTFLSWVSWFEVGGSHSEYSCDTGSIQRTH